MNQKVIKLVFGLVAASSFAAQTVVAQTPPGNISPVVVQPVQTFLPGPDGRLSYSNADVTKLIGQATQNIFDQRKDDLAFLQNSIKAIVDAYNTMYTDIYLGKLQKASQDSTTNANSAIQVADFLKLSREYAAAKEIYLNKLAGIKAIPEGGLPSVTQMIVTENKSIDVPKWRDINVAGIITTFTEKLAGLDAQVNELVYQVVDRAKIQQTVKGFKLDLSKVTLILPAERDQKRSELLALRKQGYELTKAQDVFTGYVVKYAKNYVYIMGEQEQYRWRNEQDLTAMKGNYDRIVEAFWARSWLRFKYGMPMGSIKMNYKKQWLGLDELMRKPSEIVDFGDEFIDKKTGAYLSVRAQGDLEVVQENIRNNARAADHRAVVFGSYNPIAIAASLWTTVTGRHAQMETASMVLKLIAADINEEMMVISAGGRDKMNDFYVGRYYSTPEGKAAARKLECAFDSATIEAVLQQSDPSFHCNVSDVGQSEQTTSSRSMFLNVDQRSTDQQQNFQLAKDLEIQLNTQDGADAAKKNIVKGMKL